MSSKMSNAPNQYLDSLTAQAIKPSTTPTVLLRAIIESLMDGVLVINDKGEIIQCNNRGRQICKRLRLHSGCNLENERYPTHSKRTPVSKGNSSHDNHEKPAGDTVESGAEWKTVPSNVWAICQTLLNSQQEGPGTLVPEQQLTLSSTASEDTLRLRIRVQRFTLPTEPNSPSNRSNSLASLAYTLVILEDRDQSIKHLVVADQKRYRLTPRETEIWQMRLRGQSYRDIAKDLVISQNTVKKHLKNVAAKRRDVLASAV